MGYDVLALAAPALAAWCTFLLCRELGTGPAALAGGLVFGFGTYEATETLNHLNLALVFTLPWPVGGRALPAWRALRPPVVVLALCVLGIFATFLETLFWATLGGAFAFGWASSSPAAAGARCSSAPSAGRARLRDRAARRGAVPVGRARAPRPLSISGRGFELDLAN